MDKLDISSFEPQAPKALDSSMVSTYMRCPRLFYLEYILGLRPKGEKIALTYGSLWHEVMELWANEKDPEKVAALINQNSGTFNPLDPKNRTAARMGTDFIDYLNQWADIDRGYQILSVEQAFDLELPNGITYCGKIDQVRKKGSDFGILDHKSTTFFTKNYYDNFELGFQMKGYLWAINKLMPSEEPKFCIIDVYHILKNKTNFDRRTFNFRPSQIEEWELNMCRITDQIWGLIDEYLEEPEAWILNGGQRCSDYGGCPFQLVHQMPPERGNRERLLMHEYVVERWDPVTHEDIERAKPEG